MIENSSNVVIPVDAPDGTPADIVLADEPLQPGMSVADMTRVALRLVEIELELYALASELDDLGMAASWSRLNSAGDHITSAAEWLATTVRETGNG